MDVSNQADVIEREVMEVDVVIVGAGPSGLAAAIRLKQLANVAGRELSVIVLEKASEIGAHILSGAVVDPAALNALIPNWKDQGAPLHVSVRSDQFLYLGARWALPIPGFLLPPLLSNHGNYIGSLGELCRWMGQYAEQLGVDIFAGFAATELLRDERGAVTGVATGDLGLDRAGKRKAGYAPGMELRARYTLLAEGARGSLSKQLITEFGLDSQADPQHFGIGIKEVWEIDPARHKLGHVEHHLGWPLSDDTGGGGFVYHAADSQVFLGHVMHLNYSNPYLSPFEEMQRWKTHPRLSALLAGGKRIAYGARAMTSGGWQSIPQLAAPGAALLGCSAGFMNVPRIKGSHNAMWSGMKTAEVVFEALQDGRSNDLLLDLNARVTSGPIADDLHPVRNAKPLLSNGTVAGTLLSGLDLWTATLFRRSLFGTLHREMPDHAHLKAADQCEPIVYPRPDGVLTFDRSSSVFLANLSHDENQPVHLQLKDRSIPVERNLPLYAEPAQRYCPAGVYEIVSEASGLVRLQINAANCIHCKTCDIKDPSQNIEWVPPEGGSGPNYSAL